MGPRPSPKWGISKLAKVLLVLLQEQMAVRSALDLQRRTVDSGRTDQRRLDPVGMFRSRLEYDLVDVTMERIIGKVGQLVHSGEVIVFLGRPLSQAGICGVFIGQDPSTAGMEPESRIGRRVSLGET